MRYKVNQRVFSFVDKFMITDDCGNNVFNVEGEARRLAPKIKIKDLGNDELVCIEEKIGKFIPEYDIFIKGKLAAIVKKIVTPNTKQFIIESKIGDYSVNGDYIHHEFSVLKGNKKAAYSKKEWFKLKNSYEVEVAEEENAAFLLALMMVIDEAISNSKTG